VVAAVVVLIPAVVAVVVEVLICLGFPLSLLA
jgi:hypothetical protein